MPQTVTFKKVETAIPMGEYKPTTIDEKKAQADILVEAANGGSFTISLISISRTEIFSWKGVKTIYSNGKLEITRALLDRLGKSYKVKTNF